MNRQKFVKNVNEKLKKLEDEKEKTNENSNEEESNSCENNSFSSDKKQESSLKNLTVKEALEEANKIGEKYKSGDYINAPESLNLEKISVPNKSKEEISKQAKNSISEKYENSKANSNKSFENKIDEILKNNQHLISKNEDNKKEINEYYDSSKKETENQMLKRGLARSSIVIGELAKIEGSRANDLSKLLNSFQESLNNNEKQIQEYNSQKQQAIEEFDIKKALELENKISSLTEEYEKAKKDAITFNNNVEKLEAEYKKDLEKQKLEKQKETLKLKQTYGDDYYKEEMHQKQYEFLESYLDSLDPDYALNLLLTNKDFKIMLQDKYATLYKHIANKL